MRAKTRAMAVSAGAALVVVPLSGAAAVAITGKSPVTPDSEQLAIQGAEFANQVEQIGAPVAANASAEYSVDIPSLTVKVDPPPPPPAPTVRRSSARPVANSADVAQAIAGSSIVAEASKY